MYKIKHADAEEVIKKHLEEGDFMKEVQKLMWTYMTKDAWDYYYKKDCRVKLKVKKDSDTYRFLEKYSKEENLKKLLVGDFGIQCEIIKDVYEGIPNAYSEGKKMKKHFIPIGERKDDVPKDSNKEIDDFNSIMRSLFEDQLYEGKSTKLPRINKEKTVSRLGLRVGPYCGRTFIFSVSPEREGKTVKVKPQIDHFLPKSQFPFLAVNIYNLIPSCTPCNMAPAKGEQSPLVDFGKRELRIMHPYLFDDKAITFLYDAHSEAPYDASEMDIKVDYHGNTLLKSGYNGFFFIDELYKYHNVEAHNLYVRMKTYKSKAEIAYKEAGLPADFWEHLPELFIGYPLTEDQAMIHPLFKFNKDIYEQLLDDFEAGKMR